MDNTFLEKYSEIYISYFQDLLEGGDSEEFFKVDIYTTDYFVAMNFITSKDKNQKRINFIDNSNPDEVLKKLSQNLVYEEVMDNLFIQKNIRGYEQDSFYIIKTKSPENWHKSIARYDANCFMDEILLAGKKQLLNNGGLSD